MPLASGVTNYQPGANPAPDRAAGVAGLPVEGDPGRST